MQALRTWCGWVWMTRGGVLGASQLSKGIDGGGSGQTCVAGMGMRFGERGQRRGRWRERLMMMAHDAAHVIAGRVRGSRSRRGVSTK